MEPPHWIVAACVAALTLAILSRVLRPRFRHMPYTKRRGRLAAGELRFYRVLPGSVPPGVTVFARVRLMGLLSVPDGAWRQYDSPASGMHADFVLADAETTEALLVIELDDRSHRWASARDRDAFKDAVLQATGVPVLRVRAAGRHDQVELGRRILAVTTGDIGNLRQVSCVHLLFLRKLMQGKHRLKTRRTLAAPYARQKVRKDGTYVNCQRRSIDLNTHHLMLLASSPIYA